MTIGIFSSGVLVRLREVVFEILDKVNPNEWGSVVLCCVEDSVTETSISCAFQTVTADREKSTAELLQEPSPVSQSHKTLWLMRGRWTWLETKLYIYLIWSSTFWKCSTKFAIKWLLSVLSVVVLLNLVTFETSPHWHSFLEISLSQKQLKMPHEAKKWNSSEKSTLYHLLKTMTSYCLTWPFIMSSVTRRLLQKQSVICLKSSKMKQRNTQKSRWSQEVLLSQHFSGYPYFVKGQSNYVCQNRTTYQEHWTNKILKSVAKQY